MPCKHRVLADHLQLDNHAHPILRAWRASEMPAQVRALCERRQIRFVDPTELGLQRRSPCHARRKHLQDHLELLRSDAQRGTSGRVEHPLTQLARHGAVRPWETPRATRPFAWRRRLRLRAGSCQCVALPFSRAGERPGDLSGRRLRVRLRDFRARRQRARPDIALLSRRSRSAGPSIGHRIPTRHSWPAGGGACPPRTMNAPASAP